MSKDAPFPAAESKAASEEGTVFAPRFDRDGLLPVVTTSAKTGEVLMLAHMNAEALALTVETGEAHYWSRSRGRLWRKGEESGNTQRVVEMRTDCDQDAIWLIVETAAPGPPATPDEGPASIAPSLSARAGRRSVLALRGDRGRKRSTRHPSAAKGTLKSSR